MNSYKYLIIGAVAIIVICIALFIFMNQKKQQGSYFIDYKPVSQSEFMKLKDSFIISGELGGEIEHKNGSTDVTYVAKDSMGIKYLYTIKADGSESITGPGEK